MPNPLFLIMDIHKCSIVCKVLADKGFPVDEESGFTYKSLLKQCMSEDKVHHFYDENDIVHFRNDSG